MANTILLSIISILLTALLGLLSVTARELRLKIDAVRAAQMKIEARQNNIVRITFLCLSRLHPDKGPIISETMSELFVNGVGGMNGVAKSAGAGG